MRKDFNIFTLHTLFFLLICLSFSIPKVSASTYDFTIPSALTSLTSSDLQQMKDTLSQNNFTYYTVTFTVNNSIPFRIFSSPNFYIDSSYRYQWDTPCKMFKFNSDFTSIDFVSNYCNDFRPYINGTYNPTFILFSTSNPVYPNFTDTYNYTYIDETYTYPLSSSDLSVATLEELMTAYYSDDYPLLTSFYTIVLDKISFICGYFTSNYLYLSFFAIFLIIFIIYLLKRRIL